MTTRTYKSTDDPRFESTCNFFREYERIAKEYLVGHGLSKRKAAQFNKESVKKIILAFGGTVVRWPKMSGILQMHRASRLRQKFTGKNHAALAIEYGISEFQVRALLKMRERIRPEIPSIVDVMDSIEAAAKELDVDAKDFSTEIILGLHKAIRKRASIYVPMSRYKDAKLKHEKIVAKSETLTVAQLSVYFGMDPSSIHAILRTHAKMTKTRYTG